MHEAIDGPVTLVVTSWWSVEPGIVRYVCPNLGVARATAKALRNAVRWFVVRGDMPEDIALAMHQRGESVLHDELESGAHATVVASNDADAELLALVG